MKSVLAVAAGAVAVNAMSFDADVELFREFKNKHAKVYASDEHEMERFQIFKENVAYINSHNLNADTHGYTLGINQYADMTNAEYRSTLSTRPNREAGSLFIAPSNVSVPDSVDWRDEKIVTPVKNQGQCGSCWAFSTVAALEGQYAKKEGNLVSFSEQQLVDCSRPQGNMGCNGGLMDQGFQYIQKYGIEREDDYTYTARDGTCKFDESKVVTKVTGFVDVKHQDEDALKTALATVGPISVAIDASHQSFQLYHSGVYNPVFCSSTRLDHGVTAVGYGAEGSTDYWLIKNSWGAGWGESGYVKIARNHGNKCGVATQASYPLL